jgi:hypothetical protein
LEIEEAYGPLPVFPFKNYYIVDGREECGVGLDGTPTRSTMSWAGDVLVSCQKPLDAPSGDSATTQRRFLLPARRGAAAAGANGAAFEELCVETTTPSGLTVRAYYGRRSC